ncbi:lysM and putative peptidoglycan-binding domain-containing protein 4 isoform X1 [Oryzias melastigma]|uniref:LysM and putative peptidoglycan-binding domain-containing protein 4 n=1 Tax=Oryzias melastigma TaxID=30732 RepID=A0A3B3D4D0_ORYME|nr:lysM and putative peptidoglycan-binding domain-containing protein 4 isoform X1 [Oryzias melastigma]XP_024136597.1 lysM and putative peptidoglycan-binding domain-containing protein 4 isoform X1 [Oryzias melastigma]
MRRGEHGSQAFQAPVDVHASADGQVFMFRRPANELTASSDDEELSVVEMRQTKPDSRRNVQLLERKVLEDDNLSKLALQYGCKVGDIKRVNNLMREQDLFALKSIKIPVQKHSFLTETLSGRDDPLEETPHSSGLTTADRTHLQQVTDFLVEVDNDIDKLIQTTADRDEDPSEKPRRFGLRQRRSNNHGADWGIQWWNAVVAMLLIGIVLPLFYVIYFKTKDGGAVLSDGLHSSTSSPNSTAAGFSTRGGEPFKEPG